MFKLGEDFQRCQKNVHQVQRAYVITTQKRNSKVLQCERKLKEPENLFLDPTFKPDGNTYVCFIHIQHTLLAAAFNLLQGKSRIQVPSPKVSFDAGFSMGVYAQVLEHIFQEISQTKLQTTLQQLMSSCHNILGKDEITHLSRLQRQAIYHILDKIEINLY